MKKSLALVGLFFLAACQSPSLIKAIGAPEDQLANAEFQMQNYPPEDGGAFRLAWRSVEEAIKSYEAQNNTQGLGDAYSTYAKINKYFGKNYNLSAEQQLKAISYYQKTNYNPGLATSYSELAILQNTLGQKTQSCDSSRQSINKFEEMKKTHPNVQIPIYNPNYSSVRELSLAIHKELGCTN